MIPESPTFSIIITCYNYGPYLKMAIDSVLLQNHSSTEIIVVDDGSTDNTPDIAQSYGQLIRYLRLNENLGAAGAWHEGMKISRGKYLCKLDADDWQLPGFLQTVENEFEKDDKIGIVACSVQIIKEGKTPKVDLLVDHDITIEPHDLRTILLKGFPFRMPGTCFRRQVLLSQCGPIKELYQIHDWELFLRCLKGWKARFIKNALACYRVHNNSITQTSLNTGKLLMDFKNWLSESQKQCDSYLPNNERSFLNGSMAILLMQQSGIPYGPKSFYRVFMQYRNAVSLVKSGGVKQFVRLHYYLLMKMIKIIKFSVEYIAFSPLRILKYITRHIKRMTHILRHGGPVYFNLYLKEEIYRNTITLLFERKNIGYSKNTEVECNICGWKGTRFLTLCGAGYVVYNCMCPNCGSFPRHRGFYYLVQNYLVNDFVKINYSDGLRLMFAPEYSIHYILSSFLQRLEGVDCKKINELVYYIEDIQKLSFPDESVDFLSCFHVVEHVPDDIQALKELCRILKKDGKAIICVPITFGKSKTTRFGEPNMKLEGHYYEYGEDFSNNILEAGFSGEIYRFSEIIPNEIYKRLSLQDENIYYVYPAEKGQPSLKKIQRTKDVSIDS